MNCHDCGAQPGELHNPGCAVERCPDCGGQALQCLHSHGDRIFCENTSNEVLTSDLLPWDGEWPGVKECREYGFYCKMTQHGWQPCSPNEPGAREDLNTLIRKCLWDRAQKKFVLRPGRARCTN